VGDAGFEPATSCV